VGAGGNDTFYFSNGDSGNTAATADRITDFVSGADQLDLAVDGSASNFVQATNATITNFDQAQAFADALLTGKTYAYVGSGTAGTDGYLFIDETGDGKSDEAITLSGLSGATGTFKATDIV
jgi:hypothetical protein